MLSGRSNTFLLPERYSFTWAAVSDRTEVSFSSMGSRFWLGRYNAVIRPEPSSATLTLPMRVRNVWM